MYDIRTATENYYSFSEPNVRFTWLQTAEQWAIMNSAGLQIYLQTHGSLANQMPANTINKPIRFFSLESK